MKTRKEPDLPIIYWMLAKRIDADTSGAECTTGEAEVRHRGLTFWVYYTFTREYMGTHSSYDEEPTGNAITSLRIEEWRVFDTNDDDVSVTFDPSQIESYFNTPDYTIDYRDEN